jgi:hypothetical protein
VDVAGARALKLRIERRERERGLEDDALTRWLEHERNREAVQEFDLPVETAARDGGAIGLRERIAQYQSTLAPRTEEGPALVAVATPAQRAIQIAQRQPRGLSRSTALTALWILAVTIAVIQLAVRSAPAAAPPVDHAAPVAPASAAVSHASVPLQATTSYDPFGSGDEHSADAAKATDGNPNTHWETHSYFANGFQKPGTGLVIRTAHPVRLATITVLTDSPGFQARILVGTAGSTRFSPDSAWQAVGANTRFSLSGKKGNTWLLWVRLPTHNGHADINEVRARL